MTTTAPAASTGPAAALPSEAMAKLQEAMKAFGGTTDVDRKRAAARLADLVKTDDDDTGRFARRHLPGRDVDEATVRELRDIVVGVSRLVALVGRGPAVDDAIANLKRALMPHIDRLEREAAGWVAGPKVVVTQVEPQSLPTTPQQTEGADQAAVERPAIVPLQVMPDANANFPKPSFAQVSAKSLAPVPPPAHHAAARPTTAEVPSAVMRATAQTGPSWMSTQEPTPAASPPPAVGGQAAPPPPSVAPAFGPPPASVRPQNAGLRGFVSPAAAPASTAPPVPAPHRASLGETRFVSDEPSTATLPRSAAPATTGLPFAASPEPRSVAPRPASPMSPMIHDDPAMPSASGAGQAPPSVRPRQNLGQTIDQDAAPVSRQSLPFREAGLPPHLAQMTVETYALFFALMHVYPERQTDIFTQYGLRDRVDKDALDRHWLSRLTEDAALSARWRQLRDQYVAHYRATR